MPKLCEFQNCKHRAYHAYFYGKPERCNEHKEDRRPQYAICQCGNVEPSFNYPGETRAIFCSLCKKEGMIDMKHKNCPCGKRPSYNYESETKARYCVDCKKDGMIDVKHKKCVCGKMRPLYNHKGETRALYCSSCKSDDMINVETSRCLCGKAVPLYNHKGETRALYCSSCKKTDMINVVVKRCSCGKYPKFNYRGAIQGICCASCKKDGMIDVKSKKCSCGKQPNFNYEGKSQGICCTSCKKDGMVNVVSQKCQCGKATPHFNYKGETKAICCASCKKDGMIDVKHTQCPCGRIAYFNYVGETQAICCLSCKKDNMINVINKRCKGQDGLCPQTGNRKYRGYCTFCFSHLFPNDPLTFQIRSKTKEIAVRDFINSRFEGFQHDTVLYTGNCDCTHRRRVDHRKLIKNTILAIETDEHQHNGYNKIDEEIRYDDLYMIHSGKWIFIRYNPDKYIDKNGARKNPGTATRLIRLEKEILKQIERIENGENEQLLEIIKLYYDE